MNVLSYTEEGFLIVPEIYGCSFGEEDSKPYCWGSNSDCFFCKYADFRKKDYKEQLETESRNGMLYSVCHNEKNKKKY